MLKKRTRRKLVMADFAISAACTPDFSQPADHRCSPTTRPRTNARKCRRKLVRCEYGVVRKRSHNKLFAGFLIGCGVFVFGSACFAIARYSPLLTGLSPFIGAVILVPALLWMDRRKLL